MPRTRKLTSVATCQAGPILKWAGGKTKLLPEILPRLPERMRTYYEPFIGGGAVFFALANLKRFRCAVISDQNREVAGLYTVVQKEVELLIEALQAHAAYAADKDYFCEIRARDPEALPSVERAARLVFLNRTCFNGLYRVNRKGQFNVPFGSYNNPRVLNREGLRAASRVLQGVAILEGDFEAIAKSARRGDAVYFDPPYVPVSATASFTAYGAEPFDIDAHQRLAKLHRRLSGMGVASLISNSDCAASRRLYRGLQVRTVRAARAINAVGSKRGRVNEILVGAPRCQGKQRNIER